MQAKTWSRAAGTAEATPQGKIMNPCRRLGTGEAVVKTANAKAKNKSVAVDPLATKKAGGSTTVSTTTIKMAANFAVEDSSKDCWELPENKDKRPDWWRPPEMRGNHNNNQGKRNKKEKTEQLNKIELSKEAFVRLVRDAQKGREKNGMEADNSKDDTNNSNDSDSLYSLYSQRTMSLTKAKYIPLK
jgi:hypothetical protein